MDLKLPITKKKLAAIIRGDIDEFYLSIQSEWTKRLFSNSKKQYVIGIGWTDYTIHRDADNFRNFSNMDNGTNEDYHYMKRKLDNIREDGKLKPFETITFVHRSTKTTRHTFKFEGWEIGKTRLTYMDSRKGYVFVIKIGKEIS